MATDTAVAPAPTPAREVFQRLARNAWNWDLPAFCARTGFKEDDYGKKKFQEFNDLVRLANKFDQETMEKLCAPPDAAPPPTATPSTA